MNKIETFTTIFERFRPYMIEESINICQGKINQGPNLVKMTEEEKAIFEVKDYENLSVAAFFLLHSGFGGFSRNYVHYYKVNRLLVGFRNHHQLVHFANFIVEHYLDTQKNSDESHQRLADESKNLTEDERKNKYFSYKHIMSSLRENPFPPNRMELLDLLKQSENIDESIESSQELLMFIEPLSLELSKLGEQTVKEILAEFEPDKEEPTKEAFGVAVTRERNI